MQVEHRSDLHTLISLEEIRDWLENNPQVVGFTMSNLKFSRADYKPDLKAFKIYMEWDNSPNDLIISRAKKLSDLGFHTTHILHMRDRLSASAIMRSHDWAGLAVAHVMLAAEDNG